MGEFIRDRLPDPIQYFDGEDVPLKGPGPWKTGPCHFHGGSDSLRVKVSSGAWVCMACRVKGGDVLSHAMQFHNLDFVEAARKLGAYVDDDKPHRGQSRPATLSPRDAMEVVALCLLQCVCVIGPVRRGELPSDGDWQGFLRCVGQIEALATEYRT
jgi:hypothetical protein